MVVSGLIIILASHVYFLLLPSGSEGNPVNLAVGGMIGHGIFSAIFPLIISCIELVLTPELAGLGFGLVVSVQTGMTMLVTIITGLLHDETLQT